MRPSRYDRHSSRNSIGDDVDETADTGTEVKEPEAIEVFTGPHHDPNRYGGLRVVGIDFPLRRGDVVPDF